MVNDFLEYLTIIVTSCSSLISVCAERPPCIDSARLLIIQALYCTNFFIQLFATLIKVMF